MSLPGTPLAPTVYTLGTAQTSTGMLTCVAMKSTNTASRPTQVILPNGTFVVPDMTNTIIVPFQFVAALQNAGWQLVAASNSPSITVP